MYLRTDPVRPPAAEVPRRPLAREDLAVRLFELDLRRGYARHDRLVYELARPHLRAGYEDTRRGV